MQQENLSFHTSKYVERYYSENNSNRNVTKWDGSDTPFSQALSFLPRFCTADKH